MGFQCRSTGGTSDGLSFQLCVDAASFGMDVKVSLTNWTPAHRAGTQADWVMKLYRRQSNGTVLLAGTRTGYVSADSPSHRIFTNVKRGELELSLVFTNLEDNRYNSYLTGIWH